MHGSQNRGYMPLLRARHAVPLQEPGMRATHRVATTRDGHTIGKAGTVPRTALPPWYSPRFSAGGHVGPPLRDAAED